MPQIPYEPVQQVMPQGSLAPMRIEASPADFGAQTGQTLQQTGSELMQNALARQQFQNETTVNDVINNKFFPAFQDQYQKYYALQGKDAVDQLSAWQQSMRDLVSQFRGDFANQAQQKMFDMETSRRLQFEFAGMGRYADQQNKIWQARTNAATVDRYINSAADKYNDPQAVLDAALGIANQISGFNAQSGQGAEVARQQTAAAWNKLYDAAIMRQAVQNIDGAKKLFDDGVERGLISGVGQTAMEAKLKPYLQTADASRAYSTVTSGPVATRIAQAAYGSGVEPSTALSIWSAEGAVASPETKNPRSDAMGVFQFMPGTWADAGGTEENRADLNEQIAKGVGLIKQNMVGFKKDMGRWPQPWESYLAHQQGLGGAEKLLQSDPGAPAASLVGEKAVTENGGTPDMTAGEFLTHVRQYFQTHAMQFNADGTPTAQNLERNFAPGLQAMTDLAEKEHPGDPEAAERYRSFFIQQAGQTLRAARMTDLANREILRSGLAGPNGAKSMVEFLSDPARAQAYAEVSKTDPGLSSLVSGAIDANAQGTWDPPASTKTNDLHDELKGMQTTDRNRFSGLDLMQYYGGMPGAQLQALQNDQALIRNGDPSAAKDQIHLTRALAVTAPLFARAGIEPDPASQSYNIAVGRLDAALRQWSANNNNKLPDDGEIMQTARRMLFSGDE